MCVCERKNGSREQKAHFKGEQCCRSTMLSYSHTTDQVVYLNIVKSRNNNSSTEGGPVSNKDGLGEEAYT